ncbi:unnamed protein product, partial [Clonostachys byssicola]
MKPASIYDQVPLKRGRPSQLQLRLLSLAGGADDEPLAAHIYATSLDESDLPIFEALSYVWGPTNAPGKITLVPGDDAGNAIEAARHASTLEVTANLASALKHLRYPDRARVLWVDAICIDQSNLVERNTHVQKMGEVYEAASRVLIWLGPEADDSTLVIKALSSLSSKVMCNHALNSMQMIDQNMDRSLAHPLVPVPFSENESRGLNKLLRRPWFGRLWVIQEAIKGSSRAVLVCGHSSMLWSSFTNALFCILKKDLEDEIEECDWIGDFLEPFLDIHNTGAWPSMDNFMRNTRMMSCTDHRDRIYAVAPLAGVPLNKLKITPDYSLPVSEVYKNFMLKWIDFSQTLGLMGVFEINAAGPSWIPGYNSSPQCDFWTHSEACCGIAADVKYLGSNKLRVAGVQFATVEGVKPLLMAECEADCILSCVRNITPRGIQSKTYPTGCRASLALAATLVCALDPMDEPDEDTDPDDRYDIEDDDFMKLFYVSGQGRSLATTKEGYYVLAPKDTQPGDAVCTLLGLENHIVLRPVGRREYRVIGQCFVHGLNFGESLLGDFPTDWSRGKVHIEEGGESYWTVDFVNRKTGKARGKDPRFDGIRHSEIFCGNE